MDGDCSQMNLIDLYFAFSEMHTNIQLHFLNLTLLRHTSYQCQRVQTAIQTLDQETQTLFTSSQSQKTPKESLQPTVRVSMSTHI